MLTYEYRNSISPFNPGKRDTNSIRAITGIRKHSSSQLFFRVPVSYIVSTHHISELLLAHTLTSDASCANSLGLVLTDMTSSEIPPAPHKSAWCYLMFLGGQSIFLSRLCGTATAACLKS